MYICTYIYIYPHVRFFGISGGAAVDCGVKMKNELGPRAFKIE